MMKARVFCSRHTALRKETQITRFSCCLKILFTDCTDNKIVAWGGILQHLQESHKRLKITYYQVQGIGVWQRFVIILFLIKVLESILNLFS